MGGARLMHLVIESATRRLVVAASDPRDPDRRAVAMRDIVPGRGTPVLTLIDEVLRAVHSPLDRVQAIGVGIGPGSFTGLRAGLATAKTIAWRRGIALVGVPTDTTIRRAARRTPLDPGTDDIAVVVPAGARDHYLALPAREPMLVAPDVLLVSLTGGRPTVALDVDPAAAPIAALERAIGPSPGRSPVAVGRAAIEELPGALLEELVVRLAAGDAADVTTLVPRYVAMPRGIGRDDAQDTAAVRMEGTWSPTRP